MEEATVVAIGGDGGGDGEVVEEELVACELAMGRRWRRWRAVATQERRCVLVSHWFRTRTAWRSRCAGQAAGAR
eukprot:3313532-Prymnesium_polylepis.1